MLESFENIVAKKEMAPVGAISYFATMFSAAAVVKRRYYALTKLSWIGNVLGLICLLALLLVFTVWNKNWRAKIHSEVLKKTDSNAMLFQPVHGRAAKKMHIAYLKTPKTGSSTLACIFYRFAFRNNLSIYLPNKNTIDRSDQKLLLSQGKQFDIFNIHTHYNHKFFTTVVKDPAIIGQVREPLHQVISRAFFSVKKSERFRDMADQAFINQLIKSGNLMENQQSVFLGIPETTYEHKKTFKKSLEKLNTEFTLMLVLERMEESVVLMKRLLNWSFLDIVYDNKNINHYDISLSDAQKDRIRQILAADYYVYEFFLNVLDKRVAAEGNDFQGEVDYFRDVQRKVSVFCKDNSSNTESLVFPTTRWEVSFAFKKINCDLIYKHAATSLKNMGRNMLLKKNQLDD